jgi:hypothetical protein
MISALASVLKCKLKPTTAADVLAFKSTLSVFTANTVASAWGKCSHPARLAIPTEQSRSEPMFAKKLYGRRLRTLIARLLGKGQARAHS